MLPHAPDDVRGASGVQNVVVFVGHNVGESRFHNGSFFKCAKIEKYFNILTIR